LIFRSPEIGNTIFGRDDSSVLFEKKVQDKKG